MSLLFVDGFDHSGTNITIHGTKYTAYVAGNGVIASTPTRTGIGSFEMKGSNTTLAKVIPNIPMGTAFIIGFAFRKNSNASSNVVLAMVGQNGVTTHIGIGHDPGGRFVIFRNAITTIIATGTTVLLLNSWYYIEFKGIIHDTTGSFEVRIDGVTEAALTLTGQDTRNVGTGDVDLITIGHNTNISTTSYYMDDLYVCDSSGSAPNNTFLGPVKIETLLPQTDAVAVGSNAGLTPSTGTDRGALVDENPANTTDYNGSATVGAKDTYNYPTMSLTGNILGIQTNLYVSRTDSSPRTVCAVVRTNADYDGATISPTFSYLYQSEIRPVNPNGSTAWTVSDINAIQVGMKVVS